MSLQERRSDIQSGGLRLEGALHRGSAPLAAVVLHPHPQYGGDMRNHVVHAVCEAFAGVGATTLRFNFRGVGASDGAFDNGRGEADDARAAIRAVRDAAPDAALVLAGYSFGASVAASVAPEAGLRALVLVSPPLAFAPQPPLLAGLETFIIAGDLDELAPAETLRGLEGPGRRVVLVPGVGHAWWPGVETLADELAAFAARLVPGGGN